MSGTPVSSGFTSTGIVLGNGGVLNVLSGGTAVSTIISAGGIFTISGGGSATATVVMSRGLDQVLSGGVATGTLLSGYASEKVYGTASGTVVGYAAAQTVFAGGRAVASLVDGTEIVSAGGITSGVDLVIGTETVSSGGVASGTVIAYSSGGLIGNGQILVASGGTMAGTVVEHDGYAALSAGALAVGTILDGGDMTLAGGTAIGATIGLGSVETVGVVLVSSAYVSGIASATTIAGGTLDLDGGSAAGGILFAGSGPGLLEISGTVMPGTAISGFAASDAIDLQSVAFTGSGSVSINAAADVLTVTEGGSSFALQLTGNYEGTAFTLASDLNSGTILAIDGGTVTVSSGVISSGIVVSAGGVSHVARGGTAIGTVVMSRGLDEVMSGGVASDTVVSGYGAETVYGAAFGTMVGYAGSQTVFAGGTATASLVDGSEIVSAGGVTSAVQLIDGDEFVLSGGVASGTLVAVSSGNGEMGVASGGTMAGTVINRDGYVYISAGGLAVATILTGGDLSIGGGTAIDSMIGGGSVETVGVVLVSSAFISGIASATTIAGGTLDLAGGSATGGILFAGGAGLLEISGTVMPATTISGFAASDEIDLQSLAFTGSGSASLDASTDVLTVTERVSSFLLQLSGPYAGVTFSLGADAGAGTLVRIDDGSTVDVSSGVTSSGVALSAGGVLTILSGGTAIGTEVTSRGVDTVQSGGLARGTVVSADAREAVYGTASGTVVNYAGSQTVFAGGTATASVVDGAVIVLAGGVTSAVELILGTETVASGGVASGTVVGSASGDGQISIAAGGTMVGTVVNHDGYAYLSVGGIAVGTVLSGGDMTLGGGTAIGTTIGSGGLETAAVVYVFSTGVYYSGVASATTIAGGTLDLDGGTAAGGILFTGDGPGLLAVSGTVMPGTAISGFASSDEIDLQSVAFTGAGSASLNASTDKLTVTEGGSSFALQLAGNYAGATFDLSPDIGAGTVIGLSTAGVPAAVSCFAAGTRIAAERGPVAVEQLVVGDRLATVDGALKPVAWIGTRRVDCRRHPEPARVWPVLIAAHAFGPDLPKRDLLLSPDHAIFAEGVLIPVKHLINGASIRQIVIPAVTYLHVALDAHEVVLAEGLPVESYLDTGDARAFASLPVVLHPVFGSERADIALLVEALGYAPLRVTGPEVEAVKARLAMRYLPHAHRAAAAPG